MSEEKPKKPAGWRKFDELARRVAQVPKYEVQQRVEDARNAHPRAKKK